MECISIREAARKRLLLSPAEVQALEGVIQNLEAEVERLKGFLGERWICTVCGGITYLDTGRNKRCTCKQ